MVPYWQSLIIPILGKLEKFEEGQQFLNDATHLIEETDHRFFESDIYRIQGDLLLWQGAFSDEVAGHYQKSMEVARKQEAKSFELPAAMSLGRLWHEQGKTADARDLLADVYNWFTEGFETRDLRDARALLEAWG